MELICQYCGVNFNRKDFRWYCSQTCANRHRGKRKEGAVLVRPEPPNACKNNPGLACDVHTCARCGWNPKVAEARTRAYMEGLK